MQIAFIWLFMFILAPGSDGWELELNLAANPGMNELVPVQDDTTGIIFKTVQPIRFSDGLPQIDNPDTLDRDNLRWVGTLSEEVASTRPDTVYIWKYERFNSFDPAESDSTLRWVNMLNLFDRFHQERGAITYRMGTVGRVDGIELHAFESRHMNLELEGLKLNDPLTGAVNWNRLPIHKISEMVEADYGATYRAKTRLRDHYLVQPRTYLNFDESKLNYRSLEFSFTQNFKNTTNLELAFWDRRDGAGYNRQEIVGRQVFVRVYHQLSEKWLMKGAFINNSIDRQEPFGYTVNDPAFFSFNRFVESPKQANANAVQSSKDIYLQLHHRNSTHEAVRSKMGLHMQSDQYSLTSSVDTVATDFQRLELFARQYAEILGFEMAGTARAYLLNEREEQNLTEKQWTGSEFTIDVNRSFFQWFSIDTEARWFNRNDTGSSGELSGRFRIVPSDRLQLSVFGGMHSRAPDLQSLYWKSNLYTGSETLENENSILMGAMLEFPIISTFSAGLRGDHRYTENASFVNSEGLFVGIDPYEMLSGTGWISHHSKRFEGEVSATIKQFITAGSNEINMQLADAGDRIWLKGNIYWKNYLFGDATFVKAGFSGVYSPNPFRTAEFMTPLNRWQHGTHDFVNPSYYRVDLDVSARVRWFMVLLKWENILDRVQQLGYFESVGYPMPERRFRFGIRVLFTN